VPCSSITTPFSRSDPNIKRAPSSEFRAGDPSGWLYLA